MTTFKCCKCGTEYESMFGDEAYKQALGCASEIYKDKFGFYLQGFYGSIEHDMKVYDLKGSDHTEGTICDECINTLIKEGNAALIEDGVW